MTNRKLLPRALALFALLACAIPAAGTAAPSPSGVPTEASEVKIELVKTFRGLLNREGVKLTAFGGGTVRGPYVEIPGGEGMMERVNGTGWIYLKGGLRFRHGTHRVTLRRLVANTAKGWITATANGHNVVFATLKGPRAVQTSFGVTVKTRGLLLGARFAAVLNKALGLHRVFTSTDSIGTANVAADLQSVQLGPGELSFAFNEGFRKKLEALGVAVVPNEVGAKTSDTPLTFTWSPESLGTVSRGFLHGGISAGVGGLSFIQGEFTTQVRLWNFGLGFESNSAVADWDLRYPDNRYRPMFAAQFGAIDVRAATQVDTQAGTIGMPPTAATLAPAAAAILNEAFAAGKSTQFSGGEPLGSYTFFGRLR